MTNQNLIIYNFTSLYHILEELGLDLKFEISFIDDENSLNDKVKNLNNYLIISNKKISDIGNQLVLNNIPINIFKLVEKINIEFLRIQFNSQSEVRVNNYIIDLENKVIKAKLKMDWEIDNRNMSTNFYRGKMYAHLDEDENRQFNYIRNFDNLNIII